MPLLFGSRNLDMTGLSTLCEEVSSGYLPPFPGVPDRRAHGVPAKHDPRHFWRGPVSVGQRNSMDVVGQGELINRFCQACRDELFTDEELATGNLRRDNLIPLLDDSNVPGPKLEPLIFKPPSDQSPTATPSPPKCTWASFLFSSSALAEPKALA
ncbi:hypothetical protein VTO42DRAFT_1835 [Malbranchea cinnamomea]